MNQQKNTIVIVGGGPVGLYTAGLLKTISPDPEAIDIIVFEKRTEYIREHLLKINPKTFSEVKLSQNNPKYKRFEELKNRISGKVPTKVIEAELGSYAKDCGVRVIYGETIMSMECLKKNLVKNGVNPESLVAVIGADGRRSLVRTKILPVLTREDKNYTFERLVKPYVFVTEYSQRLWAFSVLRGSLLINVMNKFTGKLHDIDREQNLVKEKFFLHQLVLAYRVKGPGQDFDFLRKYKTLKLMEFPCQEVVGKYQAEKNETEITAIFIISEKVAKLISEFTPANPGKFNSLVDSDPNILPLKRSVDIWFNAKMELFKQEVIKDSERLKYVPLSVYTSTCFADVVDDLPVFIVGDAAFGVPYFKALNNGLVCAYKLSGLITRMLANSNKKKDKSITDCVNGYQEYMRDFVYGKFSEARKTTDLFKSKIWFVKISSKVPWSFIQWWDGKFKKKLYKTFYASEEDNHKYDKESFNKQFDKSLSDLEIDGLKSDDIFDHEDYSKKTEEEEENIPVDMNLDNLIERRELISSKKKSI